MWASSIFRSLLNRTYEGVVTDPPKEIECIVYNGDHMLMTVAHKLMPKEDGIKPGMQVLHYNVREKIRRDMKCHVLFSVWPSKYCRYDNMQRDFPDHIKRMYAPGGEEHTKFVSELSSANGDFIYKLGRATKKKYNNCVVIDDSDSTLLSLLYKQKRGYTEFYYTNEYDMKRCISISALRQMIHKTTGNFSKSGYNDALMFLPLCLQTCIPNLVAYQISLKSDNVLCLLRSLSAAKNTIYDVKFGAVLMGSLFRVINSLEADEIKMTTDLLAALHSRGCREPYNPSMAGIKKYREAYYDGIIDIDDKVFARYVISYISALVELSKYMKGRTDYIEHIFDEAPLLYDIRSVLNKFLQYEVVHPTKIGWQKESEKKRSMNRFPPLCGHIH